MSHSIIWKLLLKSFLLISNIVIAWFQPWDETEDDIVAYQTQNFNVVPEMKDLFTDRKLLENMRIVKRKCC